MTISCRFGFEISDIRRHDTSTQRLKELIAAHVPWFTAKPTAIYWSTLAVFEPRLARTFGHKNVWLAGDAAHQAAPVGVQSMNSGLFEARELAAIIARGQRAGGSTALLDQFAADMHGAWLRLLDAERSVGTLAGADPWVRQRAAKILPCVPASGDELEPLLAQIGLTASPSRRGAGLGA